jgi:hypothetical protein
VVVRAQQIRAIRAVLLHPNPRLRFPVQKIKIPDLGTVKKAVMILGMVSNKTGWCFA